MIHNNTIWEFVICVGQIKIPALYSSISLLSFVSAGICLCWYTACGHRVSMCEPTNCSERSSPIGVSSKPLVRHTTSLSVSQQVSRSPGFSLIVPVKQKEKHCGSEIQSILIRLKKHQQQHPLFFFINGIIDATYKIIHCSLKQCEPWLSTY